MEAKAVYSISTENCTHVFPKWIMHGSLQKKKEGSAGIIDTAAAAGTAAGLPETDV